MRVRYLGLLPEAAATGAGLCDAALQPAPEGQCPRAALARVRLEESGAEVWVCLVHGFEAGRAGDLELKRHACRLVERVPAFIDGEMTAGEAEEFRGHVAICRTCDAVLEADIGIEMLMRAAHARTPQSEEDEGAGRAERVRRTMESTR